MKLNLKRYWAALIITNSYASNDYENNFSYNLEVCWMF